MPNPVLDITGGGGLPKTFLGSFWPKFGLKIRGSLGPLFDPPLLPFKCNLFDRAFALL